MTPAVEQLRDIRGLDSVAGWPSILSAWMLVAGVLVSLAAVAFFYRRRRRARGRWRTETADTLRRLHLRLERISAHEAAGDLCELLRRIAMAYGGRRACAGLVGEAWLAWLEGHDPEGFPWRQEGRCLLELPYAPPHRERRSAAHLAPLVRAAEAWVSRPPGRA